jgi:predicted pyridoxine 5'-phosphate oxidase superfamily flavin-nucleotide-binding protein
LGQQRADRHRKYRGLAARAASWRATRLHQGTRSCHLAFADYSGNRQHITVGNLAENDRMLLLLLDYAERMRLKIWGRGEAIDDDPALLERVRDPDYKARAERVIRMRV